MSSKTLANTLFFQMLRIRRIEEAIADEYAKQEMRCPTHLCIGQEAIAAGVCANFTREDIVMSTHRSHGHFLAKGGTLPGMIAEFYGKKTGVAGGWGGSQHLIDLSVNFFGATPIVGSTIPVAVGISLAMKLHTANRILKTPISVVFFGDAAMEEGVVHEAMNFAALKQLPMLFICENNQYSTYTPIRLRQPKRPLYGLAKAHGLMVDHGDGNNALQVYEKSKKIVASIRLGKGPGFLEFRTYRLREHVGPNVDKTGYRPKEEIDSWLKKDPILRLQRNLKRQKLLSDQGVQTMEKKIGKEIEQAFLFAKNSPFPSEKLEEEMVYATTHLRCGNS